MARSSKLTPAVEQRIVEAIRAGNYRAIAARAAGIDERTLFRWTERGSRFDEIMAERRQLSTDALKRAVKNLGLRPRNNSRRALLAALERHERRFAEFAENVERAAAEAELKYVKHLEDLAGKGDVKAVTFMLERSRPKRWGRRDHLQLQEIPHEMIEQQGRAIIAAIDAVLDALELSAEQRETAHKIIGTKLRSLAEAGL